ncbi:CDP-alcohol phosphatidyltransferase [Nesidiocoris tenuis]|uniref:CDP-alcohol phosphatidyltransferase n=1 Tax=Nesidiocoris tenuis TaxID=355587 RepID=A0ABN7B7B4_9HEMI|nr:CDP-alcohol phosphatidyltransferase [Nesidiocoris tenuis]
MNHKYLEPEMLQGFDNYKYSAIDNSPLSTYVMHPFWNRVVLLCPRWMAPNLLTFLGFLLTATATILLSYYDWNFSNDSIPGWVFLAAGILIFIGYTLDGIDGKQARNTGTSSPLGELFDHGLDSWTAALIPICLYTVFGRAEYSVPPYRYYFVIWNVFLTFYITHWEKYITGTLFLPWGYDLSMLTTTTVFTVMAFTGREFWALQLTDTLYLGRVIEMFFYLSSMLPTLPVCILNIRKSYIEKTGKNLELKEAIRPLAPLATLAFVTIPWATLSKTDLLENHPRAFYLMTGNVFSNITCRLVVSQMSGTRCRTTNGLIAPVIGAAILSFCFPMFEVPLLYGLLILTTWAHAHYGICVVDQMCDHLGIRAFKITPREKMK